MEKVIKDILKWILWFVTLIPAFILFICINLWVGTKTTTEMLCEWLWD